MMSDDGGLSPLCRRGGDSLGGKKMVRFGRAGALRSATRRWGCQQVRNASGGLGIILTGEKQYSMENETRRRVLSYLGEKGGQERLNLFDAEAGDNVVDERRAEEVGGGAIPNDPLGPSSGGQKGWTGGQPSPHHQAFPNDPGRRDPPPGLEIGCSLAPSCWLG